MKTTIKRIARIKDTGPEEQSSFALLSIQFLRAGEVITAMVFTSEEGAFLLSETTGVGIVRITA